MASDAEQSTGQKVNTWVQTIGIIVAAAWGGYSFIYKEVLVPKSAPVNVTLDLQLRKLDNANSEVHQCKAVELIPVEMTASATNPSSRTVFLLSNLWSAWGSNVAVSPELPRFAESVEKVVNSEQLGPIELNAQRRPHRRPVAIGRLFRDTCLKPNERVVRRLVFHVPCGEYDVIDVNTDVITVAKEGAAALQWHYKDSDDGISHDIFRVAKNGELSKIESPEVATDLELEDSESSATLSMSQ